jgi:hypothetical protein
MNAYGADDDHSLRGLAVLGLMRFVGRAHLLGPRRRVRHLRQECAGGGGRAGGCRQRPIAPFYGQPAGDKLFRLLAGHYGATKDYLGAAAKKDAAGESKAPGRPV